MVDLEDEVEALDVVGEETFGFQAEEEAGISEDGLDRGLEDDTMQQLDPQACYVCGVRGHLARDCPQNATTSREGRTFNAGNQSGFVQRGTGGDRSRGRRTRFSGLNVVYDAEGYEYPVDDYGMIRFPKNEQNNVNNEDQTQQENC